MSCARVSAGWELGMHSWSLSLCRFRKREWSGKQTPPPPPPLPSLPAGASPPRPSRTPNRPKSSRAGRAAAAPSNHQRKTWKTERSRSTQGRRANSLSTSSTVTASSRRCSPRSTQPMHGPFTSLWMLRPWNYMTIMILSNTPWISVLWKYVLIYHLFLLGVPLVTEDWLLLGEGEGERMETESVWISGGCFYVLFPSLLPFFAITWGSFFFLPCKADDVHKAKYDGILSSLWVVQLFNWCSWHCVALWGGALFHRIRLIISHFQKLLPTYLVVVADRLTLSNSNWNVMVLREMCDGFVVHAWLLKSLA